MEDFNKRGMVDTTEKINESISKISVGVVKEEIINDVTNKPNYKDKNNDKTDDKVDDATNDKVNDKVPNLPPKSSKKKNLKKRCNFDSCNKKIKMFGFDCKCGFRFCTAHRYDFAHNCTVDNKTNKINELKDKLVKITPKKLNRI